MYGNNNFIKRLNNSKYKVYRAKNMLNSKLTLNQNLLNTSEIKPFEFSIQNQVEMGTLSVGVFTALQALPVKGAKVMVYDILEDGTEHIHAHNITDENGKIPDIKLPVQHDPNHLFGSSKYHFTVYNIRVTADNFYPVNIVNFRIFPNMKTIYSIEMLPIIPGETVYTPEEILEIPSSVIDETNL